MNVRALSSHAAAIALAAISFAESAGAGLVLCGDVTFHASVGSFCPDSDKDYVKNKSRIDHLFDTGTPTYASALAEDWKSIEIKFKPGSPRFEDRPIPLWAPLGSSADWSSGSLFVSGGKWAQAQLHGGQPSQSVPEPSSIALLGIGLIGAVLSCRLKRI